MVYGEFASEYRGCRKLIQSRVIHIYPQSRAVLFLMLGIRLEILVNDDQSISIENGKLQTSAKSNPDFDLA